MFPASQCTAVLLNTCGHTSTITTFSGYHFLLPRLPPYTPTPILGYHFFFQPLQPYTPNPFSGYHFFFTPLDMFIFEGGWGWEGGPKVAN